MIRRTRLEPGINAAELAAKFIYALRDFESARCRNHSHPLVPAGLATINPGVVRAGARSSAKTANRRC